MDENQIGNTAAEIRDLAKEMAKTCGNPQYQLLGEIAAQLSEMNGWLEGIQNSIERLVIHASNR